MAVFKVGDLIKATGNGDERAINTQLTGSKVEYVRKSTDPRPDGKANDSLFLWDTRQLLLHDGDDWRDV